MGIFGGEKYSKEGWEEAKKEADFDEKVYRRKGGGFSQSVYDRLIDYANKSRERVEKIHGKGQAEAIALNKEYDRLLAQATEALQAVADFEREKLGMHKEGVEEANAEK